MQEKIRLPHVLSVHTGFTFYEKKITKKKNKKEDWVFLHTHTFCQLEQTAAGGDELTVLSWMHVMIVYNSDINFFTLCHALIFKIILQKFFSFERNDVCSLEIKE